MSAAILDRARAFDILAQHMTPERITEIADTLGAKLLAEVTPTTGSAAAPESRTAALAPKHPEFDEIAEFLVSNGFERSELVARTTELAIYLKEHRHLTRSAAMHVWLGQRRAS